jgi:hypothetical protein
MAANDLKLEVYDISKEGFWVKFGEEAFYLSFEEHPWFEDATEEELMSVITYSEFHFHWPLIDGDLSLDILRHPEKYPLRARRKKPS